MILANPAYLILPMHCSNPKQQQQPGQKQMTQQHRSWSDRSIKPTSARCM